jgi:hypothetical protein
VTDRVCVGVSFACVTVLASVLIVAGLFDWHSFVAGGLLCGPAWVVAYARGERHGCDTISGTVERADAQRRAEG